ncbi:MAG: PQQ-dependent sugar dehydrogenase [Pseudomonadota bacterium]|nr:PQQ-dependent sugar dehydrogenase [Pseudomonadota bacterium]
MANRASATLSFVTMFLVCTSTAANQEETIEEYEARVGASMSDYGAVYNDNCAVCHGEGLQGTAQGTALMGVPLRQGNAIHDVVRSIAEGKPDKGMPAWAETFNEEEIKSLALWILESREGTDYMNFFPSKGVAIPQLPVRSEHYRISVEPLVTGLDSSPYSIAVLPGGEMLVTEKKRGLRVIATDGKVSELIKGTPTVYDDGDRYITGLDAGIGWLFDVAPHPAYADNGWIYLHYSARCEACNRVSRQAREAVSMNTLVRGRIVDGAWVDQEIIWQPDIESFSSFPDASAGGRIAFDPEGFVFISVGMKNWDTIQNLKRPDGKIHRLHFDGRVPTDNPFVDNPEATSTIWSYGHRSPQGLEFDPGTRRLWGTEHGPRGGDEINLLRPGRNYGWPSFSKGQNYDGTVVDRFRGELELSDIEQPVVDLTPSPAVSSFVIYQGTAFPAWQGDFIVATLKARDLYRIKVKDGQLVHKEMLIENLARIRDIEIGSAGEIYLLLEDRTGGQIARLTPAVIVDQ